MRKSCLCRTPPPRPTSLGCRADTHPLRATHLRARLPPHADGSVWRLSRSKNVAVLKLGVRFVWSSWGHLALWRALPLRL